ncbi:MAG: biotin--[acetyl-CoA-carboxylase] ligase [Porphyromonas sp.]|nr:biotin--[acetyl-CoA-carboxylase] ligase [Porphyromonas sp.]
MKETIPTPIYLKTTTSTNNYLQTYLEEQPETECWQVVYTDNQTEGRGQRGNIWVSEPGKNLTMSILFRSSKQREEFHPFDISVFVSLAIRTVIKEYLPGGKKVSIKWPNDIFVGDKKVAGILIENEWEGSVFKQAVVGIGINLNQMLFDSQDAPNATSVLIEREDGKEVDIYTFMMRCLEEIVKIWRQMKVDFVSPRDEYNNLLYRKDGRLHEFETAEGILSMMVEGVDTDGMLLLYDPATDKRCKFAFKEVSYIL